MARRSRRRRGARDVAIRPSSSASQEGISVGEGVRREGVFEKSPSGKVSRQRRRTALWRTAIGLVVLATLVLGVAWAAVGLSALSVHRGLSAGLDDDEGLQSVIREPFPDSPPLTIAVLTARDGDLLDAGVLGVTSGSEAAWIVSVPASASVPLGEDPVGLGESFADGSPARVVAALESVVGTDVAGYVEIDVEGIVPVASGPVSIPEEGSASERQEAVLVPVMRTLAETRDSFGLLGVGRMARGGFRTQMSLSELAALSSALGAVPGSALRAADAPLVRSGDVPVPDAGGTRALALELASGQFEESPDGERVEPGSVGVEVQNGAGLDGIAGDAARILESDGYDVLAVGNASQFVYDETLVVHAGAVEAAEQVAGALPVGRVVASRGIYRVKGDVLVIVGSDWVGQR